MERTGILMLPWPVMMLTNTDEGMDLSDTKTSLSSRVNGRVVPKKVSCPYGYHIDLDFVRYCEALSSGAYLKQLRKIKKYKRKQRRSLEVMLGHVPDSPSHEAVQRKFSLPDMTIPKWTPSLVPKHPPPDILSTPEVLQDALKDAMLDFEETYERSQQSSRENSLNRSKAVPPSLDLLSSTHPQTEKGRLGLLGSNTSLDSITSPSDDEKAIKELGERNSNKIPDSDVDGEIDRASVVSFASSGVSQGMLQGIREQMANSLRRTKELEEQVKSIPVLHVQLSVLREERRQLFLQLQKLKKHQSWFPGEQKEKKKLEKTEVKPCEKESLSLERMGSLRRKQKEDGKGLRDVGTTCSVLTRDVGVSHVGPSVKTRGTLTLGLPQGQEPEKKREVKSKPCLKCFQRSQVKMMSVETMTDEEKPKQSRYETLIRQLSESSTVTRMNQTQDHPPPIAVDNSTNTVAVRTRTRSTNTLEDILSVQEHEALIRESADRLAEEFALLKRSQVKETRVVGVQTIYTEEETKPFFSSRGLQTDLTGDAISSLEHDVESMSCLLDKKTLDQNSCEEVRTDDFGVQVCMEASWENMPLRRSIGTGEESIYTLPPCPKCMAASLRTRDISVGTEENSMLLVRPSCTTNTSSQTDPLEAVSKKEKSVEEKGINTEAESGEKGLVHACDKCQGQIKSAVEDMLKTKGPGSSPQQLPPVPSSRIPRPTGESKIPQRSPHSIRKAPEVPPRLKKSGFMQRTASQRSPSAERRSTAGVVRSASSDRVRPNNVGRVQRSSSAEGLGERSQDVGKAKVRAERSEVLGGREACGIVNKAFEDLTSGKSLQWIDVSCVDDSVVHVGSREESGSESDSEFDPHSPRLFRPIHPSGELLPRGPRKEPSKELMGALKVLKDSMTRPGKTSSSALSTPLSVIQREWFQVAGRKDSDPHSVEDYMDVFEEVSHEVLRRIVNLIDPSGNTVMHYAVSYGNFDLVSVLLDSKVCDVNIQNKAGYTCLMLVALARLDSDAHGHVVRRLFSLGDVNIKASQHGQTALMLAVSHGRLDMVRLLIDAGADLNIQDADGSTALMCASEHGHLDIVRYILAQPDCDASMVDSDGSTALQIAMDAGHKDIGVLLYAHMNFSRGNSPYSSLRMRRSRGGQIPGRSAITPPPRTPPPASPSPSRKSTNTTRDGEWGIFVLTVIIIIIFQYHFQIHHFCIEATEGVIQAQAIRYKMKGDLNLTPEQKEEHVRELREKYEEQMKKKPLRAPLLQLLMNPPRESIGVDTRFAIFRLLDINKYDYYDTPDGHDLMEKLKFCSRYSFAAGATAGMYNALMYARPKTRFEGLLAFTRGFIPFAAIGPLYASTVYVSTNMREKDDQWNHFFGGLSIGALYTAKLKLPFSGAVIGLLLGFVAALQKDMKMHGGFLVLPNTHFRPEVAVFGSTMDYSTKPSFDEERGKDRTWSDIQ
ncbi:unnamed protein product [Darwinula stevensoni]|uniref:NADH-ubiquinone oxidoreductase subunit B14.7 n=1 Tax=Darwinula stevensoni TaxID=69355 RepID=A0A7R8X9A6_9CRUS|nr:unnamed protein product [Darwinula stevensoni]CAG0885366.1 unnamed protein product [Darwinula stevensoni]